MEPQKGATGGYQYMDEIFDVMSYSGMPYNEVMVLPIDVFLLIRKTGYIRELQKTEEGQKYLKDCERYKVTEPDIEGLQRLDKKLQKGG